MRRRITLSVFCLGLVLILAIGLSISGCKTQATAALKQSVISVFVPDAGNAYYQNKVYGYSLGKELLKVEYPDYAVKLELYDAGGYDKPIKQIAQIEDAITRKVNGIVLSACDSDALVEVTKKALAAGIPVVGDDVLVNTDVNMKASEYSYRVGLNSGEYLAKALNGKGNVVLIKGPAGVGLFVDRAKGVADALAKYPDIKIIGEQFNNNDIMTGRQLMEDWVSKYPTEIDAVWSTNSMVVTGACDALKAAGVKQEDVLVIAIDFSDIAFEYMSNGWIDGLVPAQPIKLARMTFMNAFYASVGREIPKVLYTTDDIVINKESLPTFDLSDSIAPKDWKPDWKS
ncbi:MAG: sugar ABC transporter substrate-binding protein [Candidatus Humimicrobiaceae bacterium]